VFFKLNDWLEIESDSSDLWLEDPNKVGGGGFCEVNDNWLWDDGSVSLLIDLFGKEGAGKTLF
jgi:hypothetical protein